MDIVVGTPGTYFLFKVEESLFVGLIGHKPKIFTYCDNCRKNNMTLEIIRINKEGIVVFYHTHIRPDEDIKKSTRQFFGEKEIEIIRFKNDEQFENLIWKELGNPGENYQEELLDSMRNSDKKVYNFSLSLRLITFRRHPLVFDEIKDI